MLEIKEGWVAYQVQKEEYTAREHSLTNSIVFVTDHTAIDELGKDF